MAPVYKNDIFSSPPQKKENGEYSTPARAKIRALSAIGFSQHGIAKKTGIPRSSIQSILYAPSSHRQRQGKTYKPYLVNPRTLRQAIRFLSKDYTTRKLSYASLRSHLQIKASAKTLSRSLRRAGYKRCIACPRPFISKKAAKSRLSFSITHRWWGTSDVAAQRPRGGDWRKVVWSDECTFETGKIGRVWITRRADERRCPSCIKSVYRSGRTSLMIWGAIGWTWKSKLVFLDKLEGHKGICSQAYLEQVLQPVVFPYFDTVDKEEYIFMEDGAKIHKGKARLPRLQASIRGFSWPPSSPDLNPIEKVWRWMKDELKKLPYVPTTLEDLRREVQALWDRMDPADFQVYTHRLTCKIEDVIENKGFTTIN
jgi:hypothetical protein